MTDPVEKATGRIIQFYRWLLSGRESHFDNVDSKVAFMKSLPVPESYIDRSFLQYRCQSHFNPLRTLFDNLLALPLFIAFLVVVCLGKRTEIVKKPANAVAIMDPGIEFIPTSGGGLEGVIDQFRIAGPIYCDATASSLIFEIIRKHWLRPYFVAKCAFKLGRYGHVVAASNCTKVFCSSEYSFTSSILTEYCDRRGITHVNVMHGDKLLNVVDAFSTFHTHCVWDLHYQALFTELRSGTVRYVVDRPPALLSRHCGETDNKPYDFTYYLGWELKEQDLLNISINMRRLARTGAQVCIRKHPLYGSAREIGSLFSGLEVELPSKVSIDESLRKTRSAISLYTTVFWQAKIARVDIVIDDVSNEDYYLKLLRMKCIWMNESSKRLSNLLQT